MSELIETLTYFYQIPYSKNVKVGTKSDNFLLNNIFILILILFFETGLMSFGLIEFNRWYRLCDYLMQHPVSLNVISSSFPVDLRLSLSSSSLFFLSTCHILLSKRVFEVNLLGKNSWKRPSGQGFTLTFLYVFNITLTCKRPASRGLYPIVLW